MIVIRTSTVPLSLDVLLEGQLKFLSKHYEIIAVSGEDKHLEIVRTREGVKTVSVKMYREINILLDIISLWKLYWCFKKLKPHVVHSITPKAGLLSMLAAKFSGVPIRMHTFTGLIFPSKKGLIQKLLIQMDRVLCWAATNIYPEGEGVKRDLLLYKITKKSLKVLANGNVNGIDTTHFSPNAVSEEQKAILRQELSIIKGDFVFVFIGRLVGDKGINELVKAFTRQTGGDSKESHSEPQQSWGEGISPRTTKLLLVGPFESELDPLQPQTLHQIQNNPNILTVGFQKDVRPYLAISHALAFPSYREGFPNVVMQAGAMGLPSIVTDINGCNEIIEVGKNGLVIPVKDTDVLFEKMQQLQTDNKLYTQLQQNARPMICERYEQRVVWEALLEEYHLLLKTDKPQ